MLITTKDLKGMYPYYSNRYLSELTGVSVKGIARLGAQWGLVKLPAEEVKIYALYQKDEFIMTGTYAEIAKELGVKVQTLRVLKGKSKAKNKLVEVGNIYDDMHKEVLYL